MTLWQEQPQQERQGTASSSTAPRSRREARDAERRAGETGDLSGVHPSDVYDLNSSGNIWDTLSRRAASQLTDAATEAERRTGRRVSDTEHPSEPLSYITQGRPQMPTYDASRRPSQPAFSSPDQDFRPRSFAPDEDTRTRPVTRTGTPLEYATVGRPAPGLLAEAAAEAAAAPAPEHTMSRRELRALRETGQAPTLSQTDSGAWLPTWEPQSLPKAGSAFTQPTPVAPVAPPAFAGYNDTSTVEMSAIDRASIAAEQPVSLISDEQILEALRPAPATGPILQAPPASDAPRAPRGSWPQVAPAPAAPVDEPLDGLSGFEAMIAQARSGLTGEVPDSALQPQRVRVERPFTPPRGHWSAEADDDALPFEGMLTRNVGSSTGSTNALIMSNDPQPDLLSAVNATGEIYITGSLDLPRSLSSTGAPSDNYDSSEIDRLFEASQDDSQTGDVAPVRAARAVATHTSTRSVVSPRKRRGGVLPTVLAVTAALMAFGVIALLIGGYVLRLF